MVVDEESLQNSRPRCRCLDIFLVVSITFCFLMVAAVAVLEVLTKHETQDLLNVNALSSKEVAYVRATLAKLTQGTMTFEPIKYGQGTSVGSQFTYDSTQHTMLLNRTGIYFFYIELNVTCTALCKKGNLSVHLSDLLTCSMSLPERKDSTPEYKKCWTATRIKKERRLITKMIVSEPETDLENWKLDINSSGLGIVLMGELGPLGGSTHVDVGFP